MKLRAYARSRHRAKADCATDAGTFREPLSVAKVGFSINVAHHPKVRRINVQSAAFQLMRTLARHGRPVDLKSAQPVLLGISGLNGKLDAIPLELLCLHL